MTGHSWGPRLLSALALVGTLAAACSLAPAASPTAAGAPPTVTAPVSAAASASSGPALAPSAVPSPSAAVAPSPRAAPAAAAPTGPQEAVILSLSGRPDQAPLQLAIDRGYFTQQGIQLQTVQLDGSSQVTAALATNQVDVGSGSVGSSVFNALSRNVNLRLVADFAHVGTDAGDTTLSFLVRKDLTDTGKVHSLADLKGATVGMGASPGSVADILTWRAAQRDTVSQTLPFDSQYISFPDLLAGFASKRFDAGLLTEPLVTQAVQQQLATVLFTGGQLIPGAELSLIYYSPNFASQRPEVATRFMVAYLRGVRDYHDAFFANEGRADAIADLTQTLSVKDPAVWEAFHPEYVDENGEINVQDLVDQEQFYVQHGMLDTAPDVGPFVDHSFAQAAVQQLGRR